MAKSADFYYKVHPWKITEEGFNKDYALVSESIFSLGNEYMGTRGSFEEGYSGDSLMGYYFNGIYEKTQLEKSSYKGIVDETEFIVNSADWLYTRIEADGELLDLNTVQFKDFYRELDLKSGILTRSYLWVLTSGKEIRLEFIRFLPMKEAESAAQKIIITPLNFSGEITLHSGIDFTGIHQMTGRNMWNVVSKPADENTISMLGTTIGTDQSLFVSCKFLCDYVNREDEQEEKRYVRKFTLSLEEGKEFEFTKIIRNISRKGIAESDKKAFKKKCEENAAVLNVLTYNKLKEDTLAWWDAAWQESDIEIKGDERNQQGIRYCIFQLHQTYHGADQGTIIGAKGLTGEAYSGNTFWDTEAYCLPFYIFNNPQAAKHLLEFRYLTLSEAMDRAKALDCEGAFYPIATITGRECCSLWQHASLQLQASTAVAYGYWHYENNTGDNGFIFEKGLPILIEVSRMLASRGDWSGDGTRYGFYGVMGPDEFQMMVNNNCYTNYMGKKTLEYTLDVIKRCSETAPEIYGAVTKDRGLTEKEIENFRKIAEHMYIPYEEETGIFEQHEGYFNLPQIDVDKIPVEEFPLYHHWSYDRIYRNNMLKQPDVLMMMLLYNKDFTRDQLESNYNYYEPRCIHESSLSPSVHSILASQLKKEEEAYKFFGFATRMDLDNYNRNTGEGLHTTSIAAAWMNIVYGFGGMRSDGKELTFAPSLPKQWEGYSFRVHLKGDILFVAIDKDHMRISSKKGSSIKVLIYEKEYAIGQEEVVIPIIY
ncbi:glycoside hydrolase family 65 protein [Lacrimispora sphenoides]|uniref:Maltose phosphorylase n=1 Tax=Lacrimispora sphenoides JCM 1415 TaxID=1297793 RepID=A0ABY1C9Y1_9FIRM|nr:glycosyl hydrolase family 65 protein [Lacrimispora sphenoides]SET84823.1 maltose phosphorylase [[Clostridium] sphenoides JCM 1415]SUY51739.1 Kojibiose phosphorylase [Lacrimispora sphenoides]